MQMDEIPVGLAKNIIGQKYGKLTVLYRVNPPNNITAKKPKSFWKCQCECGNQCIVSVDKLNNGNTKSCGCLSKEKASERFSIDITNYKFGNLTAIERDLNKPAGNVYWLCKCDCGNPSLESIDGTSLRTGKKTNCSLCRPRSKGENKIKEILLENNIPFVQEKSFEDCKFPDSNHKARFDFYVNNTYIIEFDGRQHLKFDKSSRWQSLEYIQAHDQFKNDYCKTNNIPIIRIPYNHLDKIQLNDLLLETSNFII